MAFSDNSVQLAPAVNAEPPVHGLYVDVDRVVAQAEVPRHFLLAAAGEQEAQDFVLARREAQRGRVGTDAPDRVAASRRTHEAIYGKSPHRLQG